MENEIKTVYQYNKDKYFVGEDSDYGQGLPNNCTYVRPQNRKGFVAQWNQKDGKWNYVENHVGEIGYVDGERVEVESPGKLPEGWSTEAPVIEDTRTPEQKREHAYIVEADPIARRIDGYYIEADAYDAVGDEPIANECRKKASALLSQFLAVKKDIRTRFPD